MAELEKNRLDYRVRTLNIKRGRITREDIDQHIAELPDDSEWAVEHAVYEEETEVTLDELALGEVSSDPFSTESENT